MRTDFARGSSRPAPFQISTESQPWAPRHVDCMVTRLHVEGHVEDYMQYAPDFFKVHISTIEKTVVSYITSSVRLQIAPSLDGRLRMSFLVRGSVLILLIFQWGIFYRF